MYRFVCSSRPNSREGKASAISMSTSTGSVQSVGGGGEDEDILWWFVNERV